MQGFKESFRQEHEAMLADQELGVFVLVHSHPILWEIFTWI